MKPDRDATCAWDCQKDEGHDGPCGREKSAPIGVVRQRAGDFSEGYAAGYDDGLNGNASDSETAWDRSRASAALLRSLPDEPAREGWQPIALPDTEDPR